MVRGLWIPDQVRDDDRGVGDDDRGVGDDNCGVRDDDCGVRDDDCGVRDDTLGAGMTGFYPRKRLRVRASATQKPTTA